MAERLAQDGIAKAKALQPDPARAQPEPQAGDMVPNIQNRILQMRAQGGTQAVVTEVRRLLSQSQGTSLQAVQMAMSACTKEERDALNGTAQAASSRGNAPASASNAPGRARTGAAPSHPQSPANAEEKTAGGSGTGGGGAATGGGQVAAGGAQASEAQTGGAAAGGAGGARPAGAPAPAGGAPGPGRDEKSAGGRGAGGRGAGAPAHGGAAHGGGPGGAAPAAEGAGGGHTTLAPPPPSPGDQRQLIEEETEEHHKWQVLAHGSKMDKAKLLASGLGGDLLSGAGGAVEQVAIGKGVQALAKAIPIPGVANIIGGGMSAYYLFNGGASQLAHETMEGLHGAGELLTGHFSWGALADFIGGVKAFIELVGHIANVISGLCYGFAAIAAIGTLLSVFFPPLAACASAIPPLIDFGQLCGGIGSVALLIGSLLSPLPPIFRGLHIIFEQDDPFKLMKQEEQFHEEAQGAIANYGAIGIQSAMEGKSPIKHIAGEFHEGVESINEGAGGLAGQSGSVGGEMKSAATELKGKVDESLGGTSNFNRDAEGMGERRGAVKDFLGKYTHAEGTGSFHDQEKASEQHEKTAETKEKAAEAAQEKSTEATREQKGAEFDDFAAKNRLSRAQETAQAEQERVRGQMEEAEAKLAASKDDPPLDALVKQAEGQIVIDETNRKVQEAQKERTQTQKELETAREKAKVADEKLKEAQKEARETKHEAHEAKEAVERRERHSTGGASGDSGAAVIGQAVGHHEKNEQKERDEQAERLRGEAEGGPESEGGHEGAAAEGARPEGGAHQSVELPPPPGSLEEIDQLDATLRKQRALLPPQRQITASARTVARDAAAGARALTGLDLSVQQQQQQKVQAGLAKQAQVTAQTSDVAAKAGQGNAQTGSGISQGASKLQPVLSFAVTADNLAQKFPTNRFVDVSGVKNNIHKFRSGIETVLGSPQEHEGQKAKGEQAIQAANQKTEKAAATRGQAVAKTAELKGKISGDAAKTQSVAGQAQGQAQRSQQQELSIAQQVQQLEQQKQQKWSALTGWAAQHRQMRQEAMKKANGGE